MDSHQSVVVRFAGDSGDGVQLMGTQFVAATALAGNDFATFPDYPAEIRAPAGTTFGVSAYQIHLGARPITTAGDAPHVLVAFNPAALKVNLPLIADGALIILNIDSFTSRGLAKAGYEKDPHQSGVLDGYKLVEVDITKHTLEATEQFGLSKSDAGRCKNFWALGLVQWMFSRDVATIEDWINKKFAKEPTIRDANLAALRAGHAYGETAELTAAVPHVATGTAQFPPGEYRGVRGSEALALGLAAAGELADKPIVFCSYPITPASPLLHQLARYGNLGVGTFQAEDEIAAVCAAIGASYGGAIGITSSSGPGIALKTEAIGLAIPHSCSAPAPYESRDDLCRDAGVMVMDLLERNIRIFQSHDDQAAEISPLTTGGLPRFCVAIGVAVAVHAWTLAITGTLLALLVLEVYRWIERRLAPKAEARDDRR